MQSRHCARRRLGPADVIARKARAEDPRSCGRGCLVGIGQTEIDTGVQVIVVGAAVVPIDREITEDSRIRTRN